MPTWGAILKELNAEKNPAKFDVVRRKYLRELSEYTGRATILYASRFTSPNGAGPDLLSITDEDLQGLMEVFQGIKSKELDLIIHSPGGSIDATEAIVSYLRSKFRNIRVIVPSLAMSAATMISCASNRIVMGKHSFLGPIDPQIPLNTALGPRNVAAWAILEQFEMAQKECAVPSKLGAWIPMLTQYGPDMLVKCRHACANSKSFVEGWLNSYMFKGQKDAKKKSATIAEWLSSHNNFKSHGRHISRAVLKKKGLLIDFLEKDKKLQDLALSVFHATNHTFNASMAVKIIENHEGRAWVRTMMVQQQMIPMQVPVKVAPPQQPKPAQPTLPAPPTAQPVSPPKPGNP
jgi:hypothetical protein